LEQEPPQQSTAVEKEELRKWINIITGPNSSQQALHLQVQRIEESRTMGKKKGKGGKREKGGSKDKPSKGNSKQPNGTKGADFFLPLPYACY
jgi:hypothetical protein